MADIEPPPLKIKTFQEAIQSLDWRMFNTSLKAKDSCNKPWALEMLLMMLYTGLKLASSTQTTLTIFNYRNSNICFNIITTINTSLQCNKLTHNHCEADYNMIIFMLSYCVVDYSDIQ